MESHSCEKTGGEGAALRTMTSNPETANSVEEVGLCQHVSPGGRRCRMPISAALQASSDDSPAALPSCSVPQLCGYHARRLLQREQAGQIASTELLASFIDFSDPAAVNRFLGILVKQVTLKRVSRRDGIALAYICQLLLNSLGAMDRKQLLAYELEELRKKNITRVIWDLPLRSHGAPADSDPNAGGTPERNNSGR